MTWNELYKLDGELKRLDDTAYRRVIKELSEGKTIFPYIKDYGNGRSRTAFYRALEETPFDKMKVVILGQDPYHGPAQANGLAFSVDQGIALPPSLQNIFKELQRDLGGSLRTNGDLSDWARQGVLLLNTSLSVIMSQPNSMSDIWQGYTDRLIFDIDKYKSGIVFVLWGGNARRKKSLIVSGNNFVIESAHPSPLSAYRGFFGSKPFSKVNSILTATGQSPINWLGE